jgi:Co/Zn/Cd efflux system component
MVRVIAALFSGIPLVVIVYLAMYYVFGFGMNQSHRSTHAMMVSGVLGFLWMIVGYVIVQTRRSRDQCPKCGKQQFYYKSDRGKFMSCTRCDSAWKAGSAPA